MVISKVEVMISPISPKDTTHEYLQNALNILLSDSFEINRNYKYNSSSLLQQVISYAAKIVIMEFLNQDSEIFIKSISALKSLSVDNLVYLVELFIDSLSQCSFALPQLRHPYRRLTLYNHFALAIDAGGFEGGYRLILAEIR
jgi:hypothetical protein